MHRRRSPGSPLGRCVYQLSQTQYTYIGVWEPRQRRGRGKAKSTFSVFEGKVSGLKDSLTAGYRWQRLWVPREGFLDLSDHGFPHLPDEERRQLGVWKHDAVYFDAIANTPCLILLGEPGMGKTHALREERRAVEARNGSNESKTLFLDLRSYSSEDRLIRDLFENPSFLGWIRGEHGLYVMLDSLDECLLRIDTVATLLGDKFQELPSVFGLSWRLACRTAEWSPGLERALRSKWGDGAFGVFEIVPLTRPDVIEAADANALDSRRFLEEVEKREVVPLAFKPVTLEFLLKRLRRRRGISLSMNSAVSARRMELVETMCWRPLIRVCFRRAALTEWAGRTRHTPSASRRAL